ncbi:hypothetical protein GCM10018793_43040 [Streptomyces sulfonofaciens]|uniref:Uncharacterized protein n=1 Tax=Streptomyces sulfonofaciens TaxID=68272 RepID=A0A919GDW2_9ACTN|nr:hypothetical protein [Streptomyces sulfonofaciens]GHH82730.1 hypothetical protein GCM10018793_43040 [Streptomyces sulfonofaciens]
MYSGPDDGIVEADTVSAPQQMPTVIVGCRGPIDAIAAPQTEAAFARHAEVLVEDDGV